MAQYPYEYLTAINGLMILGRTREQAEQELRAAQEARWAGWSENFMILIGGACND